MYGIKTMNSLSPEWEHLAGLHWGKWCFLRKGWLVMSSNNNNNNIKTDLFP